MTIFTTDGTTTGKRPGEQRHDADSLDGDPHSQLCCLEGCLTGAGIAALFIIILPAGILMTVYGYNNGDDVIFGVGILLMIAPICSLPVIIAVFFNRRRIRKLGVNLDCHSAVRPATDRSESDGTITNKRWPVSRADLTVCLSVCLSRGHA
ncbi:hypothetical protein ScPMuIL_008298 [Solemya velum]